MWAEIDGCSCKGRRTSPERILGCGLRAELLGTALRRGLQADGAVAASQELRCSEISTRKAASCCFPGDRDAIHTGKRTGAATGKPGRRANGMFPASAVCRPAPAADSIVQAIFASSGMCSLRKYRLKNSSSQESWDR